MMAEELLPAARTASNSTQWTGGDIARGVKITACCLCRQNAAMGGESALCCSLSDGASAPISDARGSVGAAPVFPKPAEPEPNRDFEHAPPAAVRAILDDLPIHIRPNLPAARVQT
jgi:hypothetical protein